MSGSLGHNFVQKKNNNNKKLKKKLWRLAIRKLSIINHFKDKQSEDPMFFYSVQVDQNNRIANFF